MACSKEYSADFKLASSESNYVKEKKFSISVNSFYKIQTNKQVPPLKKTAVNFNNNKKFAKYSSKLNGVVADNFSEINIEIPDFMEFVQQASTDNYDFNHFDDLDFYLKKSKRTKLMKKEKRAIQRMMALIEHNLQILSTLNRH